ncbi:MAG: KAP family NTPase, partial [Anaerolineae bacterium]|nr:KAP family NTPase [Anaerolineae bacterium]
MSPLKLQFLPENPIEHYADEHLGFGRFITLIEDSIIDAQPPFVFGILGDWGVGKTSILRLLEQRFNDTLNAPDKHDYVVPIWFDLWEYENETDLIYPLLYAIVQCYKETVKNDDKIKNFFKEVRQVAQHAAGLGIDAWLRKVTKPILGQEVDRAKAAKEIDRAKQIALYQEDVVDVLEMWTDNIAIFKKAFMVLLNQFAQDVREMRRLPEDTKLRFVIFVDDLDRCLPETTIKILENIKNYLTVHIKENGQKVAAPCVFVLAINPSVIYKGIQQKYRGAEVDGREYLEKILSYTFYVPEPQVDNIEKFLDSRISTIIVNNADRETYKREIDEFKRIIRDSGFNNPRKLKRILNRYLLFLNQYEKTHDLFALPNVIKLIVIAEYFPDLFQMFLSDSANDAA